MGSIRPHGELETLLQKSFEEAGLDFRVQSAATEIIGTEVSTAPSQPAESGGSSNLVVGIAATGVLAILAGAVMLCMWRRRSIRSMACKAKSEKVQETNVVVATVEGIATKDKDLSGTDVDVASVSTGTPSTNDDTIEP